MNILFLINSLNKKSGSERVAVELANKMSSTTSHSITILNRESTKNQAAYPLTEKVNVVALLGNSLQFYTELKKYISNHNFDIIIVHNMGKLSLLCAFLPRVKKLVTLEHVAFVSRSPKIQFLSKFLYRKIDQVITLTQNDKAQFDEFHSNVLVIPNFSPFPINITKSKNKQIITIGRLTDQKNYIHLLKAWKKIHKSIPDWQLNIYGEGEQKHFLQDYIVRNTLQNITLKGVVSDIRQVYEQSSFFVMSSKYEGLPMVLIEAQSFGLPVVAYNCPHGPSDVIRDNKNGLLVKNQDIDELANSIKKLALSPDRLIELSQNSLLNAQNYQSEKILNVWIEKVLKG